MMRIPLDKVVEPAGGPHVANLSRAPFRQDFVAVGTALESAGPGAASCRVVRRRTRSCDAPLAQSAERLHGKEKVYGSIP
jgi:hypothetical protein